MKLITTTGTLNSLIKYYFIL